MDAAQNKIVTREHITGSNNGWAELKQFWRSDLYRYTGEIRTKTYIHAFFRNQAYRHTFLMRLCSFLNRDRNILKRLAFRPVYEIFRHYSIIFGLEIPCIAQIGYGLYLPHPLDIVVHKDAVIGNNCVISQGVTIGDVKRGDRVGVPSIGDNVFIAPGAVVIGKIKIGNNVAIGANSVVNIDLPDNAVAAGVPARIISFKGAGEYINRIDY